jgi:hypothetical protein
VRVKYIRWVNGGYQILLADERYITCTYEFLHELLNSRNHNNELTPEFKSIMMAEFTELCWPEFKALHKEGNKEGMSARVFLLNLAIKSVPSDVCPLHANKKTGIVGDCYRKVSKIHQDFMDVYKCLVQDKGVQLLYKFSEDVALTTGVSYLRSRQDLPVPQSALSIAKSIYLDKKRRNSARVTKEEQGSSEGNIVTDEITSSATSSAIELTAPDDLELREPVHDIVCLDSPLMDSDFKKLLDHQKSLEIGGMRQAFLSIT